MGGVGAEPGWLSLDGDRWRFRSYLGDEWRAARVAEAGRPGRAGWLPARVPGCVVADLHAAGEVADPYYDRNSRAAEWAAERWWAYQTDFEAPVVAHGQRTQLVFEGIDYAGRIYLDGELLGEHEGMFVPARFEVGERLRVGRGRHLLTVLIAPAPPSQPQTGDTALVRVHKTRMSYGWDFCPRLLQQGLWQPVGLRVTGPLRLEQPWVRTQLSPTLDKATLTVTVGVDSTVSAAAKLSLAVSLDGRPAARAVRAVDVAAGHGAVGMEVEVDSPALWWPNGDGRQPLYDVELTLETADGVSDLATVRHGIRTVALEPNTGGPAGARGYTFAVNGRRLFARGWNWVPLDMLYGVPRDDHLAHLLGLARDAGVNLLRVWGGGLIESRAFYDACDRLGILVWQEFVQSSSGTLNAPAGDAEFVSMMVAQARSIVAGRRNHASLALWGGGNELMREGVPLDEDAPVLRALGEVVAELDSDRAFVPTSPSGPIANFIDTSAERPGHDVHGPWEHQGLDRHQRLYDRGSALLQSEFGVEGMADVPSLEATIPADLRWPPTRDNPAYAHRGAWWNNEPLVQAAFGGGIDDLATMVRASQWLQAEGLRYAVEAALRRWPLTSGTLPWQFNESFPNAWCTSVVDWFGWPKPGYHAVADAYRPVAVSAAFERQAWPGEREFGATLWVANLGRSPVRGRLLARCVDAGGREFGSAAIEVECDPGSSVAVGRLATPMSRLETDLFVLDLTLDAGDGRGTGSGPAPTATNRYLFSRTADLAPMRRLPAGEIEVRRSDGGADAWQVEIRNRGAWLVPGVRVADGRSARAAGWAVPDTGLVTLLPAESRSVGVRFENVATAERRLRVSAWNVAEQLIG